MKAFIKKITVMLISLVLTVGIVNLLYMHSLFYNNYLIRQDLVKFREIPSNINIANFGNSHEEYGINWEVAGVKNAYNFALSSQGIEQDYMMLDQYQNLIEDGSVILLDMSYGTLYGISREWLSPERYSLILDYERVFDYPYHRYLLERNVPLLNLNATDILKCITTNKEDIFKAYDGTLASETPEFEDNTKKTAELDYANILKGNDGNINASLLNYLERILSICRNKHCRIIFLTVPLTECYVEHFPKEFLTRYKNEISSYAEKNGIVWFDYSTDSRFSDDLSLFRDGDHLSIKGAEVFSKILYHDIEELVSQ